MKKQIKGTTMSIHQMSKEGIDALQSKLKSLQDEYRERTIKLRELKEQRAEGDNSDGIMWVQHISNVQLLESKIEEIKAALSRVKPLSKKQHAKFVQLGSRVYLLNKEGTKLSYVIVDSLEADPLEGKISDASPLGRVLMGKTLKEQIELTAPSKRIRPQLFQLIGIE
ncbi:hypothetical protein CYG49_00235 [Candidatus Saccharibacteria bacterium]|nr:MAG: hypothetical protein CYG49_00235 [Candidatus Saccharibacteria bacterium]